MVNSQVNSCMTLALVFMKNPCENSFRKYKKISYACLSTRLTVCYSGQYETVGCGCESLSND